MRRINECPGFGKRVMRITREYRHWLIGYPLWVVAGYMCAVHEGWVPWAYAAGTVGAAWMAYSWAGIWAKRPKRPLRQELDDHLSDDHQCRNSGSGKLIPHTKKRK